MRIPREVSWAASNSTGALNPFLRQPSEKLGRKRYVLPVTSDGADRDLVSYKSGDEGSSPPPRLSRRDLPGSRVACRHRRGSHRCLVLPGALDIRAPRHAACLRAEIWQTSSCSLAQSGPTRDLSLFSAYGALAPCFPESAFPQYSSWPGFSRGSEHRRVAPEYPRGCPDSADDRTFPLLLSQNQVAVSELVPVISVGDRFLVRLHD